MVAVMVFGCNGAVLMLVYTKFLFHSNVEKWIAVEVNVALINFRQNLFFVACLRLQLYKIRAREKEMAEKKKRENCAQNPFVVSIFSSAQVTLPPNPHIISFVVTAVLVDVVVVVVEQQ